MRGLRSVSEMVSWAEYHGLPCGDCGRHADAGEFQLWVEGLYATGRDGEPGWWCVPCCPDGGVDAAHAGHGCRRDPYEMGADL